MREEDMLIRVAVPVALQDGRNFVRCEVVVKTLWVLYVLVVGDTTILRYFLIESREQEMCLIAFTEIGAIEQEFEMRRALLRVIATSVEIIDVETNAKALACIHSKLSRKSVFTRYSVTCGVVCKVRDRRQRVREMKLIYGRYNIIVWLRKDKLLCFRTIDKYAMYARRTEIARRVILTTQTRCKDRVHKHVRHGVNSSFPLVAKTRIDRPYPYAARYNFVRTQ